MDAIELYSLYRLQSRPPTRRETSNSEQPLCIFQSGFLAPDPRKRKTGIPRRIHYDIVKRRHVSSSFKLSCELAEAFFVLTHDDDSKDDNKLYKGACHLLALFMSISTCDRFQRAVSSVAINLAL